VDLSLHKLAIAPRKHLKQVTLSGLPNAQAGLLTDVNKAGKSLDSFAWAQSTVT
jgi:hypothetical protein